MGICANGDKRVKFVVESVIFGIADPDLPIHYATFYGATMMIKGSLLLSAPTVKHFRSKKPHFGPKFDGFGGVHRGFKINVMFYNPKKAHPWVISRLLSYRR